LTIGGLAREHPARQAIIRRAKPSSRAPSHHPARQAVILRAKPSSCA